MSDHIGRATPEIMQQSHLFSIAFNIFCSLIEEVANPQNERFAWLYVITFLP